MNYYLHTGDKAITSNKTMNPICAQDLELELLRTRPQPQKNKILSNYFVSISGINSQWESKFVNNNHLHSSETVICNR